MVVATVLVVAENADEDADEDEQEDGQADEDEHGGGCSARIYEFIAILCVSTTYKFNIFL